MARWEHIRGGGFLGHPWLSCGDTYLQEGTNLTAEFFCTKEVHYTMPEWIENMEEYLTSIKGRTDIEFTEYGFVEGLDECMDRSD